MKLTFWSSLTSNQEPSKRAVILTAIGIFLLNIIIKGLFLHEPHFGMDEPFTLFRAQKRYGELINDLARNNHPPLFESIVWVWLRIVGYHTVALRILPLIFSALAATMLFRLGQRYFSYFVGLLAALIFTFSVMHIYFSHELRSYPLLALITATSLYIYLKGNNQTNNSNKSNSWWWSLAVVNTILIYTHYFGVFLILAQGIHALLFSETQKTRNSFIKSVCITAIAYLPQVMLVYSRWAEKVQKGHWLDVPGTGAIFNQLSNFLNLPTLSFLSVLILLSGLYFVKKESYKQRGIRLLLILFPGVFILMWLLSQWRPVFHDRYLSFTTIGLFLMLAVVIDNYPKKIKVWVGALLVIAMAFTTEYKPITNQDIPGLIAEMNDLREPNDRVLLYPQWGVQCFSFHYDIEYFKDYNHVNERLAKDGIVVSYNINPKRVVAEANATHKLIIMNYEGKAMELDWDKLPFNKPKKVTSFDVARHSILVIEDR